MDQKEMQETLAKVSNLLEKIFNILDDIVIDKNPNPDREAVVKFFDSCRKQMMNDYLKINLLNYKNNQWALNFNVLSPSFDTIHLFIKKNTVWISVLGQVNVAKTFLSEIGYNF